MRIFKYFWYDKVSLILLLLFIAMGVAYFIQLANYTYVLLMAALNIVFMVNERGRFVDKVKYVLRDNPQFLQTLKIQNIGGYQEPLFPRIVKAFILIASGILIGFVLYKLMFG